MQSLGREVKEFDVIWGRRQDCKEVNDVGKADRLGEQPSLQGNISRSRGSREVTIKERG